MMPKHLPIRFVRPWQGRAIGKIERLLAPGVAATLIEYGYAVRLEEEEPVKAGTKRKRRDAKESEE